MPSEDDAINILNEIGAGENPIQREYALDALSYYLGIKEITSRSLLNHLESGGRIRSHGLQYIEYKDKNGINRIETYDYIETTE